MPPTRGHRDSLPFQGGPWRRLHEPVPSTMLPLYNSPGVSSLSPPGTAGSTPTCRPRLANSPPAPSTSNLQAFSRPAPTHPEGRLPPQVRGARVPLKSTRVLPAKQRTIPPRVSRSSSDSWTLGQRRGHLDHALLSFVPRSDPLGQLRGASSIWSSRRLSLRPGWADCGLLPLRQAFQECHRCNDSSLRLSLTNRPARRFQRSQCLARRLACQSGQRLS